MATKSIQLKDSVGNILLPASLASLIKTDLSKTSTIKDFLDKVPYTEVEEKGLFITDSSGNIILKIDSNGNANFEGLDDATLSLVLDYIRKNYIDNELNKYNSNNIIYVSINGDDTNDGSKGYPVSSIQQAINLAEIQSSNDVKIIISGGIYSISDTIVINSSKNITIENNNDVSINSFVNIDFSETTQGSGIYKSNQGGYSPLCVYVNGAKKTSASTNRPTYWSKDGMIYIQSNDVKSYYIDDDENKVIIVGGTGGYVSNSSYFNKKLYCDIPISHSDAISLLNNNVYQHVMIHVYTKWTSKLSKIISVDSVNNTITIPYLNNNFDSPMPLMLDKILLENIEVPLEWNNSKDTFIAGTFYFDNDGYIYYKKNINEIVTSIQISSLDTAFIVNSPTIFKGLKIYGFKYNWLNSDGLCPDRQSAYMIDSAIKIYSKNVFFENCEFTNIEGGCICFYNGSHDCTINKCYFHHIGSYAVKIGEYHDKTVTPNNLVYNCSIINSIVCHFGYIFEQSSGIILFYSKNSRVLHNSVFLGYYTAITAGYSWNDTYIDESDLQRMYGGYINYNNVSCLGGGLLQDFGCLYISGKFENDFRVIGNELSYAQSSNDLSMGIYSEGSCKFVTYLDNIVYKCITGFFCNNHDYNITWTHNACYSCYIAYRNWSNNLNTIIKGNIFCQTGTYLPINNESDQYNENIFYSTAGDLDLSAYGATNLNLNPNFNDPTKGDFSIIDKTNTDQIGWKDNTYKAGVLDSNQLNLLNLYSIDIANFKALYD